MSFADNTMCRATPARDGALRRARILLLSSALLLGPALTGQEAPPAESADAPIFQVVVHADNPTTALPAGKVDKMFLKKLKRWDHGVRAKPVDLDAKSPVRKAFTRAVHGKSVTAIKSFWQRMIFSGRDVPPPEKSSENELLDYVRANPGAIGYVAAETPLGDHVKKLEVTP